MSFPTFKRGTKTTSVIFSQLQNEITRVDTDFQLVQIQKFNINKEQILLYCLKIQTQTQASSDYTTVWFPPGIWSERGFTALKSVPVQEQGALDPFRCTEGADDRTARQCSDTFRPDNGKCFFSDIDRNYP